MSLLSFFGYSNNQPNRLDSLVSQNNEYFSKENDLEKLQNNLFFLQKEALSSSPSSSTELATQIELNMSQQKTLISEMQQLETKCNNAFNEYFKS